MNGTDNYGLSEECLNDIIKRLTDAFSPSRIILFGSHAYGTPGPDSDIDLYVIVNEEELEIGDCAKRGYGCFLDTALPIELHFSGPKTFERCATVRGSLESEVSAKGRIVHAAADRLLGSVLRELPPEVRP